MSKPTCPECNGDELEYHFTGGQTWLLCGCGCDFLYGDGDLIAEIEGFKNE